MEPGAPPLCVTDRHASFMVRRKARRMSDIPLKRPARRQGERCHMHFFALPVTPIQQTWTHPHPHTDTDTDSHTDTFMRTHKSAITRDGQRAFQSCILNYMLMCHLPCDTLFLADGIFQLQRRAWKLNGLPVGLGERWGVSGGRVGVAWAEK